MNPTSTFVQLDALGVADEKPIGGNRPNMRVRILLLALRGVERLRGGTPPRPRAKKNVFTMSAGCLPT